MTAIVVEDSGILIGNVYDRWKETARCYCRDKTIGKETCFAQEAATGLAFDGLEALAQLEESRSENFVHLQTDSVREARAVAQTILDDGWAITTRAQFQALKTITDFIVSCVVPRKDQTQFREDLDRAMDKCGEALDYN